MEPRIFHGDITPQDIARALTAQFNRGNLRSQQLGGGDKVIVQVATHQMSTTGGQTALAISIEKVADGIAVQVGKQNWLGVAASLGMTALQVMRNPWALLTRLDDLAQDIENMQLTEQVWDTVEGVARAAGASFELSERLRRLVCAYCNTPNPLGEASCLACGAPLGEAQPRTCKNCGFVIKAQENLCPNCGQRL
ncbi:MAG: zinc ribbon domain-containing protein [Chloroflexi bacterium]|nr:zinc ribbon domain-containing protein [Chloroflexota bacterium]